MTRLVLWSVGIFPVLTGSLVAIGHFMGIWWEVGAIPCVVCLGVWGGIVNGKLS